MMGVAQINKITIRHYQAFWGIELSDKDIYIQKIIAKLEDFAFQCKREIDFLDIRKIDRVFRIAIRVKKKSLCDIVGLKVNRNTVFLSQNDEVSHGGSLCNHWIVLQSNFIYDYEDTQREDLPVTTNNK